MSAQLEKGYTRLADEILEKVAQTKLNGTQFRILLIVWRSTYGWQKKEHELSLGYLASATGIHKQQVKKELDKLIDMEIITVVSDHTDTKPRTLAFNKRYVKEVQSVKKSTVSELTYPTVSELADPTVSELAYQNKDINKQYNKEHKEALLMNAEHDFKNVRKLFKGTKTLANAKAKLPKLIEKYSYKQMCSTVNRYNRHVIKQRKIQPNLAYMMESTFWNGRYMDYLDEYYEGHDEVEKERAPIEYIDTRIEVE